MSNEPRDFYDAANLIEANREQLHRFLVNIKRHGPILAKSMVDHMIDTLLMVGDEMDREERDKQQEEREEERDRQRTSYQESRNEPK